MRLRFKPTHVVLAMLCIMYFITYIDRVNISTAASEIQKELHLSNTQLGLVFSAFAYPYLLFQVIGGWVGDRFGPRKTLFWCGLIWAASMVVLDASRRNQPVPRLAAWSLGTGIMATVGANLAHGIGHGLVGALVSAWPAVALAGAYELLMVLIRNEQRGAAGQDGMVPSGDTAPALVHAAPPMLTAAPNEEQVVRARSAKSSCGGPGVAGVSGGACGPAGRLEDVQNFSLDHCL